MNGSVSKRCALIYALAGLMLIMSLSRSNADSIFSINGLGEIAYPVDGQARGMGGVTIAQLGGSRISLVNPATIGAIDTTTMNALFLFEQRRLEDDLASRNMFGWGPRLISLIVPLSHGVVLGGSLSPYSDVDFHASVASEDLGTAYQYEEPYVLDVSAEGGTHLGSIAAATGLGDKLFVGASASLLFGSTTEEWIRDFSSSLYLDTDDRCKTSYYGQIYGAGLALRPHRRLTLGATYSWPEDIEAKIERTTTTDTLETETEPVDFPPSFGFGVLYQSSRLALGGDVHVRQWDRFQQDGARKQPYHQTTRISLGLEFSPSTDQVASFYKKMPWRLGFYHEPGYHVDASGDCVAETFLTCGTSLLFKEHRGAMDFTFEAGKKGSIDKNGAEEWVFRQSFSIVGWERWFERQKR